MTREYYENRLVFLEECQKLVERLLEYGSLCDGIMAKMLGVKPLRKDLVDQLLQDEIVFYDNAGNLCINQKKGIYILRNFYINQIQQIHSFYNTENAIVNSSKAAIQSAESATEANKYARNANFISKLALFSSIILPFVLFFITKCCSN